MRISFGILWGIFLLSKPYECLARAREANRGTGQSCRDCSQFLKSKQKQVSDPTSQTKVFTSLIENTITQNESAVATARGAWGLNVKVENGCTESIRVSVSPGGTEILAPGDSHTFEVCGNLCSGFWCKEVGYAVEASSYQSSCDFSWDFEDSRSVCPWDVFGTTNTHTLTCGDGCGQDGSEFCVVPESCGTLGISSPSSPRDPMVLLAWDYSRIAYQAREEAEEYALGTLDATRFDFIEGGIDSEVILAEYAGNRAIIAFRGSESIAKDFLLTNIVGWLATFVDEALGTDVVIHNGFLSEYRSVESRIINALNSYNFNELIITGHSLGSALAQICAYDLQKRGYPVTAVFGFGGPRVGKQGWKSVYEQLGLQDRTILFVNRDDPIPSLRTQSTNDGWRHVGRLHKLADGICDPTSDNVVENYATDQAWWDFNIPFIDDFFEMLEDGQQSYAAKDGPHSLSEGYWPYLANQCTKGCPLEQYMEC